MEKEIIKEAQKILKQADTGTNDCKIYNDGFMDGIRYATQALQIHGVVGRSEQLVCDRINNPENNRCIKCGAKAGDPCYL
jgi:hypothetical protein